MRLREMDRNELPLGFSFALAQNPQAMKVFSNLPNDEQHQVLQKAHHVASKSEMQALVHDLSASLGS